MQEKIDGMSERVERESFMSDKPASDVVDCEGAQSKGILKQKGKKNNS